MPPARVKDHSIVDGVEVDDIPRAFRRRPPQQKQVDGGSRGWPGPFGRNPGRDRAPILDDLKLSLFRYELKPYRKGGREAPPAHDPEGGKGTHQLMPRDRQSDGAHDGEKSGSKHLVKTAVKTPRRSTATQAHPGTGMRLKILRQGTIAG